ncbi:MAG: HAD family hydrolase [Eubacterium sp.]
MELLKFLKEKKYKTVVATSSERKRVEFILEKAGIRQYFNDIICGDEVEKGKPNPEIFLRACEKVNVNPENALVLEDSEAGIEAANVGNINVICVPDMKFPDEKYQKMSKEICKNLLEAKIYIEQYCG